MEQHINVFNSLNNFKTIVGKLISKPKETSYACVGDLVDVNGKLVFIETNDILLSLVDVTTVMRVLCLEVVNKSGETIVKHELMSKTFLKVVALNRVKIDSLVVVVTKSDSNNTASINATPDLMINKDGFAVIKHYVGKSFKKDAKIPDIRFNDKEWVAIKRFQAGERWATSQVDEDVILAGYGSLDETGQFEFPLPTVYVKQIYNTISWSEYLRRNKATIPV